MDIQAETYSTILPSIDSFNNTLSTYQLKAGLNYRGLNTVVSFSQNYLQLFFDPLFLFPTLKSTKDILAESHSTVKANKLIFTYEIDINKSLQLLAQTSPFNQPNSQSNSKSRIEEVPLNSFEQGSQISILTHSNILNISGLNNQFIENGSLSSQCGSSSDGKRLVDTETFDKDLIEQIQKDFQENSEIDEKNIEISLKSSFTSLLGKSITNTNARASLLNMRLSAVINQEISAIEDGSFRGGFGDSEIEWDPRGSCPFRKASEFSLFRKLSSSSQITEEEKHDSDESCIFLPDEGKAQTIKFYADDSASKNILKKIHTRPSIIKLEPKQLESPPISISEYIETIETEPSIKWPDPYFPILKKALICSSQDISFSEEQTEIPNTLEIISSVCFCGFNSALSLEFSDVEDYNKASADQKLKTHSRPLLFSEKIVKSIAVSEVCWISCGFEHCALVTTSGKVMTWGYGASGCLGQGNTKSYSFPKLVRDLSNECIVYVDCGGYHTVALTDNGDVYTWGRGDANQLGIPTEELYKDELGHASLRPAKLQYFTDQDIFIKSAACGEAHTLLLDTLGCIYAFGWAEDGQLGISAENVTSDYMSKEISQVTSLSGIVVSQISAGANFSACLTEGGKVYVWGSGENGQLGTENFENLKQKTPILVEKLKDEFIVSIDCGENHMICMSQDNKIFGWGLGKAGVFVNSEEGFTPGSDLICHVPKIVPSLENTQFFVVKSGKEAEKLSPQNEDYNNLALALTEKLRQLQDYD
ncbi:unnamed protein product [Blepharisma stoltei]|uniref:Uncharacterized protein n=1 Tax=Blepharisma stoltei TaxID=1481888 RepID=A0AAU9IBP4_9CILI|nr:unnamed protein product [Blepharisma stoltei]